MDQPTGTGFSYSSSESDIRHTEEEVSNDLYDFMQVHSASDPRIELLEIPTNDQSVRI